MPGPTPQSKEELEAAAHDYGIAPGGRAMILAELEAAELSIKTGVYIVWRTTKSGEGSAGVRKEGQCCRLGARSRCFCGHSLAEHKPLKQGNPQAPACTKCKCRRFNYVPMRPEECGMWHLPRRKGFNVHAWRAPCKCKHGHDAHDPVTLKCNECANCRVFEPNFVCIGCDGRGDQHETVFETESERVMAGLPVGEAYKPLQDSPQLLAQVLDGARRAGGPTRQRLAGASRSAGASSRSPEELLEAGEIDVSEYRRLIALPPTALAPRTGEATEAHAAPLAEMGSTVKQLSINVGGGESIEILTNLGRPMPQPGRDFSRPWVPAPPRRPHPMERRAPPAGQQRAGKEQGPLIEELSELSCSQRSAASSSSRTVKGARGAAGSQRS